MMGEVGGVLAEVFVCLSLLHCHSNYIHSCSSGALLIRLPADPVHCTGNCLRLGKGCYRCSRSTTREPAHAAMELLVGDICPGRLLSFKPSATSAPYKTSSINVRYVSHTWSYLLCFSRPPGSAYWSYFTSSRFCGIRWIYDEASTKPVLRVKRSVILVVVIGSARLLIPNLNMWVLLIRFTNECGVILRYKIEDKVQCLLSICYRGLCSLILV